MAYTSRAMAGANPYAVGHKIYGGGRPFPTAGPVNKQGYRERDARHRARQRAIIRRLKATMNGKHASADALRKV